MTVLALHFHVQSFPHTLTSAPRYIRSNVPLDELELRARYPPVDAMGREKRHRGDAKGIAAAYGE